LPLHLCAFLRFPYPTAGQPCPIACIPAVSGCCYPLPPTDYLACLPLIRRRNARLLPRCCFILDYLPQLLYCSATLRLLPTAYGCISVGFVGSLVADTAALPVAAQRRVNVCFFANYTRAGCVSLVWMRFHAALYATTITATRRVLPSRIGTIAGLTLALHCCITAKGVRLPHRCCGFQVRTLPAAFATLFALRSTAL